MVETSLADKNASLHLQVPAICLNVSLRTAGVISRCQHRHYGLCCEPKKAPPVTGCMSVVTGEAAGAIRTGKTGGGVLIFRIAHELKERKWRLKRVETKVKGHPCMEERLVKKKKNSFFTQLVTKQFNTAGQFYDRSRRSVKHFTQSAVTPTGL